MMIFSGSTTYLSEFLKYIAEKSSVGENQLPSLSILSKELKISVASLREQLEVARVMGFVEVKPRTGIRWIPYDFTPSLLLSVTYAVTISEDFFEHFRDLRNHLEAAYFLESVSKLERYDIDEMSSIVENAENKMQSIPPQLPHYEHRKFHAIIFSKLSNPFVQSIFTVYWDIYEYQGYAIINDLDYLRRVWHYHDSVLASIKSNNINHALDLFMEHKDLIIRITKNVPSQTFE